MDHLPGVNSEKIIGWVGGMDIPVLHDFGGLQTGCRLHRSRGTGTGSLAGSFMTRCGARTPVPIRTGGCGRTLASGTKQRYPEAAYEEGRSRHRRDLDQDGIYPGSIVTSMLAGRPGRLPHGAKVVDGTWQGGEVLYGHCQRRQPHRYVGDEGSLVTSSPWRSWKWWLNSPRRSSGEKSWSTPMRASGGTSSYLVQARGFPGPD